VPAEHRIRELASLALAVHATCCCCNEVFAEVRLGARESKNEVMQDPLHFAEMLVPSNCFREDSKGGVVS
jgi:hypothetical protein